MQERIAQSVAYPLQYDLRSLYARLLEILSGGSMFDGDKYEEASGSTGKVARIIDHLDPSHAIVQATGANQAPLPVADSVVRGARTFLFGGSQRYLSSRAASAWRYLHGDSGQPSSAVAVFVPDTDGASAATNTLWATQRQQDVAASVGAFVQYTTTTGTGALTYQVGRNNATRTINSATVTVFSQGVACAVRTRYAEGIATPEFTVRKLGALIASGDSGAAPANGDAASTLVVGANAVTFDRGLTGRLAFLAFAPRALTADEAAVLSAYTFAKYGVAA